MLWAMQALLSSEVFGAAGFVVIVAAVSVAAALWPRAVGHLLPLVFAVGNVVGAILAACNGSPNVVAVGLLLAGGLAPMLVWFSYARRSREAWAFLVAMCGVFAVIEIFVAMKLHVTTGISIGVWLTWPALKIVALLALVQLRGRYGEPVPAAA